MIVNKEKLKEIRTAAFDGSLEREHVVWLIRTIEELSVFSEFSDEAFLKRFFDFLTVTKGYIIAEWQTLSMGSHSVNRLFPVGYDVERLVQEFLRKEIEDANLPQPSMQIGVDEARVLD